MCKITLRLACNRVQPRERCFVCTRNPSTLRRLKRKSSRAWRFAKSVWSTTKSIFTRMWRRRQSGYCATMWNDWRTRCSKCNVIINWRHRLQFILTFTVTAVTFTLALRAWTPSKNAGYLSSQSWMDLLRVLQHSSFSEATNVVCGNTRKFWSTKFEENRGENTKILKTRWKTRRFWWTSSKRFT